MAEEVLLSRRQMLGTGCMAPRPCSLPSCSGSPRQGHIIRDAEIDIVMTAGVSGLVVQEVARTQGFFEQFNVIPKVLVVSDGGKCVAGAAERSRENLHVVRLQSAHPGH